MTIYFVCVSDVSLCNNSELIMNTVNNEHETDDCDNSDDNNVSSFSNTADKQVFRKQLASCFIDNNLTHVQGNVILSLLRKHKCFSLLPKDIRTVLNSNRSVLIFFVLLEKYLHFDLERVIVT